MQVMSDLRSMRAYPQDHLHHARATWPAAMPCCEPWTRLNQRKLLDRVAIDEAHCEPSSNHATLLLVDP